MNPPERGAEPATDPDDEPDDEPTVAALLATTRVLVGVAAHAMEQLGTVDAAVTLSQFRLLYTLAERGPTPSARAAEELGSVASTVTRLADHLEDAGHLVRRRERPNRSVVTLEITDSGRELVDRVVGWRRAELGRLAAELDDEHRRTLADALRAFYLVAERYDARSDLLPW